MEANNPFTEQVRLLVSLLPSVAKQSCFALKGGTAINLFVRDMPRMNPAKRRQAAAKLEKVLFE